MLSDFTVAAVQMTSTEDKPANLAAAERLATSAAEAGAQLIVLPEYFNCLGDRRVMLNEAEPLDGPTAQFLRRLAGRLNVALVGGTFCERSDDPEKAHNTSLLIGPDGAVVAVYRKLHLFDVDLPGRLTYCESSWLAPGTDVVVAHMPIAASPSDRRRPDEEVALAAAVCYDLRFPELFRLFADRGAAIVAVPAAFTKATGRDHWELLCRARAVENQCFVVAANQFGRHAALETYGHSLIVDPWGAVLASAGEGETFICARLSAARLADVRAQLPALKHRRAL